MSNEFIAFMGVAGVSMYVGWVNQKPIEALTAYSFSLLFWLATMWQWFTDLGGDGITMLFLFLFPVLLCLFFIFEEATRYFDESMKGYKADPFG